MKKAWKYILIVLLAVVIAFNMVAAFLFTRFFQPGIHSFAGYTRLDFQEKVYFVDADSKVCSGSSTITISGLIMPTRPDGSGRSFRGSMSVAKYPLAMELGYVSLIASVESGAISVFNHHSDFGSEQPDSTYWLHMSRSDPDIFAVYIFMADGTKLVAYPGQTEAEALVSCQAYWDWLSGLSE